jgi:nitrogen fixation/metabolism regulation signal transduction histidine kinase
VGAKNVQNESNNLKARLNNLDTSYINEYDNRVKSQMAQAEKDLAKAMEIGDSQAAVVANKQIAELAVQNSQLNQAKAQQERQKAVTQQQNYVQQPAPQQQQVRRPDPKAEEWASKNDWFGQDEAMTFAAFGIHKRLVEEEGFDPQTDEYYTELDRRINDKFNLSAKDTGRRPVQTVASVSRNSGRNSGKKVRLTPSQVAIAKKLGVPLEEYAKYVKE